MYVTAFYSKVEIFLKNRGEMGKRKGEKLMIKRERKVTRGILTAVFLGAAMLFVSCGSEKKAATMRLVQTAGTVGVQDENEKEVSLADNLGLYSGYQVGTKEESYAWIDLDQVKLAKMDQSSEIEIRKSENEKELSIDVRSGSMFFNVKEPLAEDESMEIQTSTMIAGIRGTCGYLERGAGYSGLGLLEGTVECRAAGGDSVLLEAGQMALLSDGDTEISVFPLRAEEVPDFVRAEVPELIDRLAAMQQEHIDETEPEEEETDELLYDPQAGLELPEVPQDGIERRVLEAADGEALAELSRNGEDLSNTEIRLGDGTYELNYFNLYGFENLSIIGTGKTRLVVNNGYEQILEAINCKNLLLYGLVMGHELRPEESGCTAGVLYLSNSKDVKLVGCDIYGCGLVGISGWDSALTAQNTIVRDCSRCAVSWMGGGGELNFEHCVFSGNGTDGGYGSEPLFGGSGDGLSLTLRDCVMQNNINSEKYQFYMGETTVWNETDTREAGNAWQ